MATALKRCYSTVTSEAKRIPQSAYYAIANRIKPTLPASLVEQITTHPSYQTSSSAPHNAALAALGNAQLGYYVGEHFFYKYPNLPTKALKRLMAVYCGNSTSASIGNELGMAHVVRHADKPKAEVLSMATKALVGGVYQVHGPRETKDFIRKYFLSRDYDVSRTLHIQLPKLALSRLIAKKKGERPISRLLKETGRKSRSPIFVVGVFSKETMLGEAYGSSIAEAEEKAILDALARHYLLEVPVEMVPSAAEESGEYVPPLYWTRNGLGDDEVNL